MKNIVTFINESLPNRIDWKEIKLSDKSYYVFHIY